jgi:uncharacterized protein (DUF2342 family)
LSVFVAIQPAFNHRNFGRRGWFLKLVAVVRQGYGNEIDRVGVIIATVRMFIYHYQTC